MDAGDLRRLAGSVYYAPAPALAVDASGRVVDYNLALDVLTGGALNGLRHRHVDDLLARLPGCVGEGRLLPRGVPGGGGAADGAPARCTFVSETVGPLRLTGTAVEVRGTGEGRPSGFLVSWEPEPADESRPGDRARLDRLHDLYREAVDRQLVWDNYAWSYDQILPLMPYYQEVVDRHADSLSAAVDGPVVDLGAGTGNVTERLVAAGRAVVAVDNSRAMLTKLRSKPAVAREDGRSLRVVEASAEDLRGLLPEAAFAGVTVLLALYDMERPRDALGQALRLLKPGGTVVITEPKEGFRLAPILDACRDRLEHLGRTEELADDLARVVSANLVLDPATRPSQAPMRAERIVEVLTDAGFEAVSLTDSHFGQCATVFGRKPRE